MFGLEKEGAVVFAIALVVLGVFASFTTDITGNVIANTYRNSGGEEELILVGNGYFFNSGANVQVTKIIPGTYSFTDNSRYDKTAITGYVNGRPFVLYEGQSKVIIGYVVGLISVENNKARVIVKEVSKPTIDFREKWVGTEIYSLETLPRPFNNFQKLILIEGERPELVEHKAAESLQKWIEDITGRKKEISSLDSNSPTYVPRREMDNTVVIVGRTQTHSLMAEIMGGPLFSSLALNPGEGYIEVIHNGDRAILVVTGNTEDDVLRAANVVKSGEFLVGNYAFV